MSLVEVLKNAKIIKKKTTGNDNYKQALKDFNDSIRIRKNCPDKISSWETLNYIRINSKSVIKSINAVLDVDKSLISFVYGKTGVGKSHIINSLFNYKRYNVFNINCVDYNEKGGVMKKIESCIFDDNVSCQKKVIVIEDFYILLMGSRSDGNDRQIFYDLYKWIHVASDRCILVLFVMNERMFHKKRIKEKMKVKLDNKIKRTPVEYIHVPPPTVSEMRKFILYYLKTDDILKPFSLDIKNYIIQKSQEDFNQLKLILETIKKGGVNKNIKEIIRGVERKCNDVDLDVKMCSLFEFDKKWMKKSLDLYDTDPTMSNLLIHQNYIDIINKNNEKESLDTIAIVADSISDGDFLSKKAKDNGIWGDKLSMDENCSLGGIQGLIFPVYTIRKFYHQSTFRLPPVEITTQDLSSPLILNKTSSICKRNKVYNYFKKKGICLDTCFFINEFMYRKNSHFNIKSFLEEYCIEPEDLLGIIKLGSFEETQISLRRFTKVKRENQIKCLKKEEELKMEKKIKS